MDITEAKRCHRDDGEIDRVPKVSKVTTSSINRYSYQFGIGKINYGKDKS